MKARVLALPLMGLSKLKADSMFWLFQGLMTSDLGRQMHWYALLPEKMRGQEDALPNVTYMWEPTFGWTEDYGAVPREVADLFNRKRGRYPVDVVISARLLVQALLAHWLQDTQRWQHCPSLFIEPSQGGFEWVNEPERVAKAMGYAVADAAVIRTEEVARGIQSWLRKYLSPYQVDRFIEKTHIVPMGIDCDLIDSIPGERREKLTVFFGSRLNPTKRPDLFQEWAEKLYAFGRDIDIWVSTGTAIDKGLINSLVIQIDWGVPKREYLAKCKQVHVGLVPPGYDVWPVAVLEQLYCGIVCVLPKAPWSLAMVGKDYPFLYRDGLEAAVALRYVVDSYEEARQKVSWVPQYVRERFNAPRWDERNCEIALGLVRRYHRLGPRFTELLRSYPGYLKGEIVWGELLEWLERNSSGGFRAHAPSSQKFPASYEVYSFLLDEGWEDDVTSSEPVLKRR